MSGTLVIIASNHRHSFRFIPFDLSEARAPSCFKSISRVFLFNSDIICLIFLVGIREITGTIGRLRVKTPATAEAYCFY